MRELVLQVQDIDDRGKDYDFELKSVWLDGALADSPLRRDPGAGPGSFHVHAQRNGRDIFVTGEIVAALLVPCARCLEDTALPVRTAMTTLLSPAGTGSAAAEAEDEDDLDRGIYEGHEVVLDGLVREHLLLESPMQPLCSPDCKGIPIPERVRPPEADFGATGTDPRLLPLRKLRAKLSGNKE